MGRCNWDQATLIAGSVTNGFTGRASRPAGALRSRNCRGVAPERRVDFPQKLVTSRMAARLHGRWDGGPVDSVRPAESLTLLSSFIHSIDRSRDGATIRLRGSPDLAGFFPQGKASRGCDAKSGVQDVMARTQLILPQADAACGRPFYFDHRTADGDRIALEVWRRATGHLREGYRLAVFRCAKVRRLPHPTETDRVEGGRRGKPPRNRGGDVGIGG